MPTNSTSPAPQPAAATHTPWPNLEKILLDYAERAAGPHWPTIESKTRQSVAEVRAAVSERPALVARVAELELAAQHAIWAAELMQRAGGFRQSVTINNYLNEARAALAKGGSK